MSKHRLLSISCIACFAAACGAVSTPPGDCDPALLLLGLEELPGGMEFGYASRPVSDSTAHSEARGYSMPELRYSQAAYWYSNNTSSSRKYQEEAAFTTGRYSHYSGWNDPGLPGAPATADEYAIGCGPINDGLACIYVARYQGVVTSFNVQFPGGHIDAELVQHLVDFIDAKAARCVATEKP